MNKAQMYIRTKGTETEGINFIKEMGTMLCGSGIEDLEVDLVVELHESGEGDYLANLVKSVRTGKCNIIIVDCLTSFYNSEKKAKEFALFLITLGAIILVKKENELVLYRDDHDYEVQLTEAYSSRY